VDSYDRLYEGSGKRRRWLTPAGSSTRSFNTKRDIETGLLVGHIPGFRGAHSQASTMEELEANLAEVVAMLLEDGEPQLEAEFVGQP
jgi:predicted RNase H-like HicB family nuclease